MSVTYARIQVFSFLHIRTESAINFLSMILKNLCKINLSLAWKMFLFCYICTKNLFMQEWSSQIFQRCLSEFYFNMPNATLREKCLYSELFWSVFSGIRTEYGEILRISPYSVRMPENTDQNNSEYRQFLRSASSQFSVWVIMLYNVFHLVGREHCIKTTSCKTCFNPSVPDVH